MLKRAIVFAAVAAALAAPSAYAHSVQFKSLDQDGDGVVSREEWNRAAQMVPPSATVQPGAGAGASAAAAPDLVVVTITPVQARAMNEQRRESLFRAIDSNGDGAISAAEAGLNTDLMNAFARVDSNGDGRIERQEFTRVHVDDGARQSQASQPASAGASSATSPWIEEKSRFSLGDPKPRSSAAGGSSAREGGISVERPPLPSREIEEASRFGPPAQR